MIPIGKNKKDTNALIRVSKWLANATNKIVVVFKAALTSPIKTNIMSA